MLIKFEIHNLLAQLAFNAQNLGVTCPWPRPLFRKKLRGHVRTVHGNMLVKFEVHNFNHINELAFNAQKFRGSRDVGYSPFLTFSLLVLEELPTCNFAPNLKSITLTILTT